MPFSVIHRVAFNVQNVASMEFLDLSGNLFNQSIGLAVHNILCRDCIGDASGISNAPLLRLLDLSSNQVDCSSVVRRYFALFLSPISPSPPFFSMRWLAHGSAP